MRFCYVVEEVLVIGKLFEIFIYPNKVGMEDFCNVLQLMAIVAKSLFLVGGGWVGSVCM